MQSPKLQFKIRATQNYRNRRHYYDVKFLNRKDFFFSPESERDWELSLFERRVCFNSNDIRRKRKRANRLAVMKLDNTTYRASTL